MSRLLSLAFALAACSSPKPPTAQPETPRPPATQPAPSEAPIEPPAARPGTSIGVATMLPDGSLQLQLRAEGSGGMVGDAMFTYAPTHEQYQYILNHVGPIKPGDSKPVPPFPDKE